MHSSIAWLIDWLWSPLLAYLHTHPLTKERRELETTSTIHGVELDQVSCGKQPLGVEFNTIKVVCILFLSYD